MRNQLRAQQTQVLGLRRGSIDTDMTRGLEMVKVDARSVVRRAYAALESGASKVCPTTRRIR